MLFNRLRLGVALPTRHSDTAELLTPSSFANCVPVTLYRSKASPKRKMIKVLPKTRLLRV